MLYLLLGTRWRPWLTNLQAVSYPELQPLLDSALGELDIGLHKHVVSLSSDATVLNAMKIMYEHGVSSIAILDGEGILLSVCFYFYQR